jgi:hypothetical protein
VPRNQPPWAEQAELLDVVEATQGVVDEVGSAGFAGFVVTPEKCRLDLYWVGAPPREVSEVVRRDRRVVVHDDADHDHAELAEAAEALSPGSPRGRSVGVEITSVAVPPEGSGLQVGVDPRRRIDVRAAAARLSAAAGVPVNVVIEGPSRPFGRIDDRAPGSAGGGAMIRVNDGGSERWAACSLGYGLRDPRTMREYTITAAHCFDEAVDATAWNGSGRAAIGDLGAMSLALDVAYVATDEPAGRPGTSAHVWSGGADAAGGGVRTVTDTAPGQGHVGLRLGRGNRRELWDQGHRRRRHAAGDAAPFGRRLHGPPHGPGLPARRRGGVRQRRQRGTGVRPRRRGPWRRPGSRRDPRRRGWNGRELRWRAGPDRVLRERHLRARCRGPALDRRRAPRGGRVEVTT